MGGAGCRDAHGVKAAGDGGRAETGGVEVENGADGFCLFFYGLQRIHVLSATGHADAYPSISIRRDVPYIGAVF